MSGRGGGRGRGWYYKQMYGGGGRGRQDQDERDSGDLKQPRYEGSDHVRPNSAQAVDEDDSFTAVSDAVRGSMTDLQQQLQRIDGKGYGAYKDLHGGWRFPNMVFFLDKAQTDPFAPPSRIRVLVPHSTARWPTELHEGSKACRVALADFITRKMAGAIRAAGADTRTNSGGWVGRKGGDMTIDVPGQHVLERTSVLISAAGVEARMCVALPAQGRSIMGRWAADILTVNLPKLVQEGLCCGGQADAAAATAHVRCVEDTEALRGQLAGLNLVAFVADGSVLPRKSGACDEPMPPSEAEPFSSPDSLAVEITLPHRGLVRGMGVRKGVTLIVGGGFHGKSTLLNALELGVYNKVPGDGRELVATDPGAVKIRAEDGRRVEGVDISPYISNLPRGRDTRAFSSDDASGSTSQAANIQEALEAGASSLLMDEDTCAANFMCRDARMQALVAPDREPITPFLARVTALSRAGVSCVLVMGGSGDYFDVADTVIGMDEYRPLDLTSQAKAIAEQFRQQLGPAALAHQVQQQQQPYAPVPHRVLASVHHAPVQGRGVKITTRSKSVIQYGDEELQLAAVEQLVDTSQTRAVADVLRWVHRAVQHGQAGGRTVVQLITSLDQLIDEKGLDALAPGQKLGVYARPRSYEMVAAVNRLRTIKAGPRLS